MTKKLQTLTLKVGVVGRYRLTFKDSDGKITRQYGYKDMQNLIVDGGLSALAGAISIDYIALGDGNTAVASGDTVLDNEVARKAVQDSIVVGAHKYFSTYFGQSEANGTIKEIGCFSGGSATLNTGTLISRISEESSDLPLTKNSSESLTIDYDLEIVFIST